MTNLVVLVYYTLPLPPGSVATAGYIAENAEPLGPHLREDELVDFGRAPNLGHLYQAVQYSSH